MTNKLFYQIAADEVARGNIDQALWIKVVADMPVATRIQQQAKYIQLRAGELAIESATTRMTNKVPLIKRALKWAVGLVVAGYLLIIGAIILIEHQEDQNMRTNAIEFAPTIEHHAARGEADSDAYASRVSAMDTMCRAWARQREVDRWMKGTDEQDAPAIAACEKVHLEYRRLVPAS